mmetsp:Transcript_45455/g.144908  ORF Transcript_45455/g.144908 Transcript_45455/m.144908 type:complete len:697 (-) Transcript_45455:133-2223(-)
MLRHVLLLLAAAPGCCVVRPWSQGSHSRPVTCNLQDTVVLAQSGLRRLKRHSQVEQQAPPAPVAQPLQPPQSAPGQAQQVPYGVPGQQQQAPNNMPSQPQLQQQQQQQQPQQFPYYPNAPWPQGPYYVPNQWQQAPNYYPSNQWQQAPFNGQGQPQQASSAPSQWLPMPYYMPGQPQQTPYYMPSQPQQAAASASRQGQPAAAVAPQHGAASVQQAPQQKPPSKAQQMVPLSSLPRGQFRKPPADLGVETPDQVKRSKLSFAERHPTSANLAHFVPASNTHCVQGNRLYLETMLVRFKNSPLHEQYSGAVIQDGSCSEGSVYILGPDYHRCFPQASVYHSFAQRRSQIILKQITKGAFNDMLDHMEGMTAKWRKYISHSSQEALQRDEAQMQALCDNGRMQEETFGLPVAATTFFFKPQDSAFCVQGTQQYLHEILNTLRVSPLGDKYEGMWLTEGACSLNGVTVGPKESKCLPHASLYLAATDNAALVAQQHLDHVCDGGNTVRKVQAKLQAQQDMLNVRQKATALDEMDAKSSNYFMFDETVYSCWQGPVHRLTKMRDYMMNVGVPERFFKERMKLYTGTCDNMCMMNGWREQRSCIRHMRQCKSPIRDQIDPYFGNKLEHLANISHTTKSRIYSMLDDLDLERTCTRIRAAAATHNVTGNYTGNYTGNHTGMSGNHTFGFAAKVSSDSSRFNW